MDGDGIREGAMPAQMRAVLLSNTDVPEDQITGSLSPSEMKTPPLGCMSQVPTLPRAMFSRRERGRDIREGGGKES